MAYDTLFSTKRMDGLYIIMRGFGLFEFCSSPVPIDSSGNLHVAYNKVQPWWRRPYPEHEAFCLLYSDKLS